MDRGLGLPIRLLTALAALVIIVAGMQAAADLLTMLLMALFLAIITTPVFLWLRDRGMAMWSALSVMISLLVVFCGTIVLLLSETAQSVNANMPLYQEVLQQRIAEGIAWLQGHGIEIDASDVRGYVDPQAMLGYAGGWLATAGTLINKAFLVVLLTVFVWTEATVLPYKLQEVVSEESWYGLRSSVENVRRYMVLKTLMSLLTGGLVAAWCWLLGVPYAASLGLLAFFLNYVPVIGSLIASLPAIGLALIQFSLLWTAVTAVGYLVINVGVSNVIEPRFLGRGLGISPLVVLLSMIVWGWVLGPLGMFLSVPLTMIVKLAAETRDETRWLALLLTGGSPQRIRATMRIDRVDQAESPQPSSPSSQATRSAR